MKQEVEVGSRVVSGEGMPGHIPLSVLDGLSEAIEAAEAMLEPAAAKAMRQARSALLGVGDVDARVQDRMLLSLSKAAWISPWGGEQAAVISAKIAAVLAHAEGASQANDHPHRPVDTLRSVLAWADDVRARADHLEHNERVTLERGRQRLSQAQEYLSLAMDEGARGGSSGMYMRRCGRAQNAVWDAMGLFSDLLRDEIYSVTGPLDPVRSQADGVRLAHREISMWLHEEVESSTRKPADWLRSPPPRASLIAAVYRAAHLVALCSMYEDPVPVRESASRFFSAAADALPGVVRRFWRGVFR